VGTRRLEDANRRLDVANAETADANRRLDVANAETADANRRLDVANAETADANRRLDVANAETADANRRLDVANAETASARVDAVAASARHQELIAEIRLNRAEITKVQKRLEWKSRTSTRNPPSKDLTHEFIITAGRKKHVIGQKRLEHVPKIDNDTGEVREPINTDRAPSLREGEFVRVSIMSRQSRTATRAIKEHGKNGEYLLQRGYMANGIDLRQNIKNAGKRKYAEVVDLTGDAGVDGKRRRAKANVLRRRVVR